MNLTDLIPIATAKDKKRLLKLIYNNEHAKAIKENNKLNLITKQKQNENKKTNRQRNSRT